MTALNLSFKDFEIALELDFELGLKIGINQFVDIVAVVQFFESSPPCRSDPFLPSLG